MTRPNRRWSMSMMCVLSLPLLTQCQKQRQLQGDNVRVRHATPLAEADNEKVGGPPATLGGPFGGGVSSPYTARETPLSAVALEQNMRDGDLVAYLNKLFYDLNVENGQLILASCTNEGNGSCANAKAAVYIQPELGANQLDLNTVTENGVVLARLINYDQDGRKERSFGVPGNTRAWWVVRRRNKQLESLFLYRDFTPDPAHPSVKLASSKSFGGCPGHTADQTQAAMVRWWDCDNENPFHTSLRTKPLSAGSYFRFVSNGPRMPAPLASGDSAMVREGSVWITCSLGCCIAQ
jgi:hypothetical protein